MHTISITVLLPNTYACLLIFTSLQNVIFPTHVIIKQNGIIMFADILLVLSIFFIVWKSMNTIKQLSKTLNPAPPNTGFKILLSLEVFKLTLFFLTFVTTFSHVMTSYLYSHMYDSVCGRLFLPDLSGTTKRSHTSYLTLLPLSGNSSASPLHFEWPCNSGGNDTV